VIIVVAIFITKNPAQNVFTIITILVKMKKKRQQNSQIPIIRISALRNVKPATNFLVIVAQIVNPSHVNVVQHVIYLNVFAVIYVTNTLVNAAQNVILIYVNAVKFATNTLANIVLIVTWLNAFAAKIAKVILANAVLIVIL